MPNNTFEEVARHPVRFTAPSMVVPLAVAFVVVVSAWAAMLVAIRFDGAMPGDLVRDPAARYRLPFYAGLISNFGVAIMGSAAAIAAFTAVVARERRVLLGAVAVFTALLGFDDLLMLHERVGPRMLGISEGTFYLVYGLFGLSVGLSAFIRFGLLGILPLIVAGLGLALSVLVGFVIRDRTLVDTIGGLAKLGGYATWSAFWVAFAYTCIKEEVSKLG